MIKLWNYCLAVSKHMNKQVLIKVYGTVQGVLLRFMTRERAKELKIKGYVKNLADGSVEIVASGKDDSINKLISWLKASPGQSDVTDLKLKWQTAESHWQGFEVLF